MDYGPLVKEEIDAGAKLAREFDKFAPIKTAFWLKASDEDQRYLYLASDGIVETNRRAAILEMLRIASNIESPYFDPFRVKIINGDNPLALAAADINTRFPGTKPTFLGGPFGGIYAHDGYLYPQPLPEVL